MAAVCHLHCWLRYSDDDDDYDDSASMPRSRVASAMTSTGSEYEDPSTVNGDEIDNDVLTAEITESNQQITRRAPRRGNLTAVNKIDVKGKKTKRVSYVLNVDY